MTRLLVERLIECQRLNASELADRLRCPVQRLLGAAQHLRRYHRLPVLDWEYGLDRMITLDPDGVEQARRILLESNPKR